MIRARALDGTFAQENIDARLWGRAERVPSGCLEFRGCLSDGYGTIRVNGKMEGAHRVAWRLKKGPIPAGMNVLRRCDNRPCINEDHLFLGSIADNNRDRHAKGRTKGLVPGAGGLIQKAKTHCPKGHHYSGDNVRFRKSGARRCAECYRIATRNSRKEKAS